jgi:putative hydrolase of the HAD superfamily
MVGEVRPPSPSADVPAALLVDFDGLMIDSERVLAEAVVHVIATRGGDLAVGSIAHLFGSTAVDHEWERLVPTWCHPPMTLAELEAVVWPLVHDRVDALPLLPGVEPLLGQARSAGWKLALATGHDPDRLHGRLDRLGVREHFDAVVLAREVGRGKPAPDIFLEAARRLAVEPANCVVLEDSLPGCEAAIAAGMAVVVCPSPVTAYLEFPAAAQRVGCLSDLSFDEVAQLLPSAGR